MLSWMVSARWEGSSTRSLTPGVTEGALRCSTASAPIRSAFSSSPQRSMCSQPAVIGCTWNERDLFLRVMKSTAEALNDGADCKINCGM